MKVLVGFGGWEYCSREKWEPVAALTSLRPRNNPEERSLVKQPINVFL